MSFRVRAAALLVVAVALVGCRVDGRVSVAVSEDGSGTVTVALVLDHEAVTRIGDLSSALKTTDLAKAGWQVSKPETTAGRTTVQASKEFGSAAGLSKVMDEVGVFQGWKLRISNGFGSVHWSLRGRTVVKDGFTQFSDNELARALDGMAVGLTDDELAKELKQSGPAHLSIRVSLPGDTDSDTHFDYDIGARTNINAPILIESDRRSTGPMLWLFLGSALLVLALGWLVVVLGPMRPRGRHSRRTA